MPVVKVERRASDGPFRVGATYDVATGAAEEHFSGVIVSVTPTGPRHVRVEVELGDAEHEHLLASQR
jgi:hypothetical protein